MLETYFNQAPARAGNQVSRLTGRLVIVGLVVVVCAVVVGLRIVTREPDGPAHPEAWNPRVAPYAAAVERLRGLKFLQPVYVDFLTDGAFAAQIARHPPGLGSENSVDSDHLTNQLRALQARLGDLTDGASQPGGTTDSPEILGYYSFNDERIEVRSEQLTPPVISVIVHELTYALLDQHFDLGMRFDLLRDNDSAKTAYGTVVEGDARRIETSWQDTIDHGTRTAWAILTANKMGELPSAGETFPYALPVRLSALQDFGQAMVSSAYRTGGNAAVDDLLRWPPTTEEHLLDPWTLVEDRQVAIPVRRPRLTPSDRSLSEGTFGAIDWLVLLEERLPAKQALKAALGWGGDSYQLFERGDGATCLRINYTGDTPDDIREMTAALQGWVGEAPTRISSASREGSLVKFGTCAVSARAHTPTASTTLAVRLALARTHLTTSLLNTGSPPTQARCAADHLVRALPLAELGGLRVQGPRAQRTMTACSNA